MNQTLTPSSAPCLTLDTGRRSLITGALVCLISAVYLWPAGYGPLALLPALAFGLLALVRLDLGEKAARWLSRALWLLVPLLGHYMVEILNYNSPLSDPKYWSEPLALHLTWTEHILGLIWYYLIAGAVWLLRGKTVPAARIAAILFFAIGNADHYVLRFRGRSIFPSDLLTLQTAANVAGSYDYTPDLLQAAVYLIFVLYLLVLHALPRQETARRPRWFVTLPAVLAAGAYLFVFFKTPFLSDLGVEPDLWTTRGNGFLLNFTVSLRYSQVEEPEGYSEDGVSALAEEVLSSAVETGGAASGEAITPTNIIVIMNEAFSDFSILDIETNDDTMPFYHSLTENAVKGYVCSSVFGGTTANSEYEFLTGNTMAFLPAGTVPYHMFVQDGDPALPHQLSALGYDAMAIHPYYKSGWNRVAVYDAFGFQSTRFLSDFTHQDPVRTYVSDRADYAEVLDILDAAEHPLFLFNVTMQNHSAYNLEWTNLEKTVWLEGRLKGRHPWVDQYLSCVRESDAALEELIGALSQREEPTLLLLFGDHQPQVNTSFYEAAFGKRLDELTAEEEQLRHMTPFLLWANYDIEEQDGLVLSINYLSSLLMETANLPLTGYQQFLSQLRDLVPVINAVGYRETGGADTTDRGELGEEAQNGILQYEQLQYNQLFDRGARLDEFFFLTEEGSQK